MRAESCRFCCGGGGGVGWVRTRNQGAGRIMFEWLGQGGCASVCGSKPQPRQPFRPAPGLPLLSLPPQSITPQGDVFILSQATPASLVILDELAGCDQGKESCYRSALQQIEATPHPPTPTPGPCSKSFATHPTTPGTPPRTSSPLLTGELGQHGPAWRLAQATLEHLATRTRLPDAVRGPALPRSPPRPRGRACGLRSGWGAWRSWSGGHATQRRLPASPGAGAATSSFGLNVARMAALPRGRAGRGGGARGLHAGGAGHGPEGPPGGLGEG